MPRSTFPGARLILLSLALFASRSWAQTAPIVEPDSARISLDEIGLYDVGYQYRKSQKTFMPVGWSGDFTAQSGIAFKPVGVVDGRKATLLHPPWRGGTGMSFQTFRFALPAAGKVRKIFLRGAIAMRADALAASGAPPKSDGVTFRVLVNGRMLLNQHRADAQWKPFDFDLTGQAGKVVEVRFETDCGPDNNASFDFSLWGDRQLVLEGFKPTVRPFLAPPPLDLRRLYPVQSGSAAPPSGFVGTNSTRGHADGGTLTYRGVDGVLQYEWVRPKSESDPPLGRWLLRATGTGAKTVVVPLAVDARLGWLQSAKFVGSQMASSGGRLICVSRYSVGGQIATLRCCAGLSGKSLVLDVSGDDLPIDAFEAGRWGPVLRRRAVTVPYYSGQVFYLPHENLFVNASLDWTASSASSQDGTSASYQVRTDGSRVPLRERVIFSAAWHAAEVLPNIPNPPSLYRTRLGKEIVLDVWGHNFAEVEADLRRLHDYGITHCAVIIHVWQRDGYDNGLPAHYPANAGQGGGEAMKSLVSTAKSLGYDIALHENYADYYPNYEGFNPDEIALDSQGNRIKAWYNEGTKIQSFAVAPAVMGKLAGQQSTQIRALYAPNSDYLDVNSATPPWFHVDFRTGVPGAGTFRSTWNNTRALWVFERRNYGGPVLGEGNSHWYWSGLLDGVEAQFGSGWQGGDSAPLAVDFDLLKIHPLQFNHGMGYYERWWQNPSWQALPPMEVLDQYRMQEVIYGHAGFLGGPTFDNLPFAWLEHHLLTPVTSRYAGAKPVRINYLVGGHWVDSSAAAKAGEWNRVQVTYDNGLVVTANNAAGLMQVGGVSLPQHGWLVSGAGVTAWTALRSGVIADYARTADSTFANARRASDWNQSGVHPISPFLVEFKPGGAREFSVTYGWKLGEALPSGARSFVHFLKGDEIVFQNDHEISGTTVSGLLRDGPYNLRVPDALPDGDYDLCIGLVMPSGERVALQGFDAGSRRIRLGKLRVQGDGQLLSFIPEPPAPDKTAIFSRRLNTAARIIDFGDVRTNGSVLIRREKGEWVLRALPRAGNFSLDLSAKRFGSPLSVRCVDASSPTLTTQKNGDWWSLKLNGAREYHWK